MGKIKKSTKFREKAAALSTASAKKPNLELAPTLVDAQKKAHKTKKDKLKEKKEAFIQKLSASKTVIESKQQGENLSLIELLQSIKTEEKNITLKDKKKEEMMRRRSKKPVTAKQREKILTEGKKSFGMVLEHPQFRSNPLATIREHMQNKLAAEKAH